VFKKAQFVLRSKTEFSVLDNTHLALEGAIFASSESLIDGRFVCVT
jgi:hypothetical protein